MVKHDVISAFKDEHAFLSNFYTRPFEWRGFVHQSGEHAFQWAKGYHIPDARLPDMTAYMDKVRNAPTPSKAKYHGRSVRIDVKEWDDRRIIYMREIVHAKFSAHADLVGMLINTGASPLVEGNDWGDVFWGKCRVEGKVVGLNLLGTILMEERGAWLRDKSACPTCQSVVGSDQPKE
jgi:ribA/ribD-fused uncharacterized protein